MKRIAIVIAVMAGLAAASGAPATEADLPEALGRCAAIRVEAERLACFDRIAASLAAPSPTVAPSAGPWRLTSESTPSGPVLLAEQRPVEPWGEESIALRINCRDDRVGLSVGRDGPVVSGASVFVTLRVNDRLAPGDIWEAARDRQAVSYPGDARDFLRQLPATGTLFVRLEGSRRWRFEGTYQLDGIDDVRRRMLAACSR